MAERATRVTTKNGDVVGFSDGDVVRWRGIPYARPPLGELRLRAPQPPVAWPGVRKCTKFGFVAPQRRSGTIVGLGKFASASEDCLTLNIVAPETISDEPLPVMFYIHGGGYFLGSSAQSVYGGQVLARGGCIFVSANYRLGALGCMDLSSLSTPDAPIDGNLFLRDLVMALQWVRDNIAAFGGDPENVTIFGESAGAHAVATLLAVPAARGLFSRAIVQSTANGLVKTAAEAAVFAEQFAAFLGMQGPKAGAALRAAHTDRLIAAFDLLIDSTASETMGRVPIGACVDGEFLPTDPLQAVAAGTAHRVPLVVGSCADESRLFTLVLTYMPTTPTLIEKMLADTEDSVRAEILAAYPNYPSRDACLQLSGDNLLYTATWRLADAHSRYAPTFVYRYDYAPRTLRWLRLGATHGTDLLPIFGTYETKLGRLLTIAGDKASARQVSDDLQTRWRTFAQTGIPGSDWPVYTESDRTVMILDRRPRTETDPWSRRRLAWQNHAAASQPTVMPAATGAAGHTDQEN